MVLLLNKRTFLTTLKIKNGNPFKVTETKRVFRVGTKFKFENKIKSINFIFSPRLTHNYALFFICVCVNFNHSFQYAIISNETVALYKEHTRCSHMLYGEAEIDHRNEIHPPSIYDSNDPDMDIANFKKLKK